MTEEERKLLLMIARAVADNIEAASTTDGQNGTQRIVTNIRDTAHRVESGYLEPNANMPIYQPDV